jgi:hypothetical protein
MFGAGFAVAALSLVFPWALVAVGLFAAVTKLMFRVVPDREPIINSEGFSREEHGSGAIVREWWNRLISLRTMDVPLRLITLLTFAQLIASGALLVKYHSSLSPVLVDTYLGHDVHMDSRVFGTCLVFLVLAWSFVLTGASFRWTWSAVLLLAFMGVTWPPLANRPQLMPWLGLTAAIWVWGLAMLWGNRRSSSHFHWAYRFFTMALLLAAYYYLTYNSSASVDPFRRMITRQVFVTSLFLVPVLFLTGTDLAELSDSAALRTRNLVAPVKFAGWWAVTTTAAAASNLYFAIPKATESAGLRVLVVGAGMTATFLAAGKLFRTNAPSRWFRSRVVVKATLAAFKVMAVFVLVVVGVSLIYLSYFLDFVPADALLALLLLGVCGAVLSDGVLGPQPGGTDQLRAVRVPFAALALIAVFLTGTHEGTPLLEGTWGDPVGVAADIPFTVLHNDVEGSRFSVTYPVGWKWGPGPDGRGGEFRSGPKDEDAGRVLMTLQETNAVRFYWNSRSERRGLTLTRSVWPFLGSANVDDLLGAQDETKAGPWFRSAYRYYEDGRNYHLWIFIRERGAETLLLVAICPERYTHFYEPIFMAMIESWRPDLTATPPPLCIIAIH